MKTNCISVIGLGYVGLPVAVSLAAKFKVIGFDINEERVRELKLNIDRTNEISTELLKSANLELTTDPTKLNQASFHIVTVPTPVDSANQPDLSALRSASTCIGKQLKKGDTVVYESTVYPGLTEEICVPLLEQHSKLKYKTDFKVGYSPERINPGDHLHRFENIKKVVSGCDAEAAKEIAEVYGSVVKAGIHIASSIAVAEAAKVIENTQRDLNIALINELSIIFHRLQIETCDVLEAAQTKWNFLPFKPGLVGGHCIGVDPYYLTHQSEKVGYIPQVILAGRRINDNMGAFIAQEMIKNLCLNGVQVKNAKIAVCGITFKENCPDIRNSKVINIVKTLSEFGANVLVADPYANSNEVLNEYGFSLSQIEEFTSCDAVVFAVAHDAYKKLTLPQVKAMLKKPYIVFDIKNIFGKELVKDTEVISWRL